MLMSKSIQSWSILNTIKQEIIFVLTRLSIKNRDKLSSANYLKGIHHHKNQHRTNHLDYYSVLTERVVRVAKRFAPHQFYSI